MNTAIGKDQTESSLRTRSSAVMAILLVVFFLGVSDNQMISPLLPLMAREFGLESGDVGQMIGPAYALAAAIAALLVGPASDKFGRRRFLLYASILFSFSLLAAVAIRDVRVLAAMRFLTGLAAGTFSTCSIAYVGDYFPYERRGFAMSVVQSGYFAALVVGVPLASLLGQWHGWRAGFIAFGLLALITFLLLAALLPEDRRQMIEPDLSARLARRFDNIKVVFEKREPRAALTAAFFVSCGFVGFIYYLGSWLTKNFGLKTSSVGLIFILVGIASLVGGVAAGKIADRFGKRSLSIASTLVLAFMLLLIPELNLGASLYIGFLIASLAFAFRQGPLQALATELVPRNARGTLVALRNTASQLGIAISSFVSGYLYDAHGYRAVGAFSATMTLIAAICIFLMREPRPTTTTG
jgi:predicted MFS family arabinose efflux permease